MITRKDKPLVIAKGLYKTAGRQYGWYPHMPMPGIGIAYATVQSHIMLGAPIYVRLMCNAGRTKSIDYVIDPRLVLATAKQYGSTIRRRGCTICVVPISLFERVDVVHTTEIQHTDADNQMQLPLSIATIAKDN